MAMAYKEERYLLEDDLRSCCDVHGWYTKGTNEDYQNLMDMLTDNCGRYEVVTTELLQKLAEDIAAHSDLRVDECDVVTVMTELVSYCTAVITGSYSPYNSAPLPETMWISVTERLPECGLQVIVHHGELADGIVCQGAWLKADGWWKIPEIRTKKVTHWMPMLDAPEVSDDE